MTVRPKSFDDYMAVVPEPQRAALQSLRETIHAAAPGAEECISYLMPSFRLDGRMLVSIAAWKAHCALYPLSVKTLRAFMDEFEGFETAKGTIRFTPERPLPASLVDRLVKARVAENAERRRARA